MKPYFVLKILEFLCQRFAYMGRQLDKKAKVNLKTYDVKTKNNNNTDIVQYLKKQRQSNKKVWSGSRI